MNNFSLTRLLLYAKAELITQRNKLMLAGAIVACGAFISMISKVWSMEYQQQMIITSQGLKSAISIVWVVFVSGVFNTFHKRGMASQNVMLPVSKLEKFLFCAIMAFVIWPAVLFIPPWLLTIIFAAAMDVDYSFWMLYSGDLYPVQDLLEVLFFISVFFAGAVIFRKGQFFKTVGIIVALMVAIVLMFAIFFKFSQLNISYADGGNSDVLVINGSDMFGRFYNQYLRWPLGIGFNLLTVLLMWLSWRVFSRMQIKK